MSVYFTSKIYAIKCNETNDVYIGSTIRPLNKRLTEHIYDMKRYNEGKCRYISSFEIVKYPSCYIELLEAYPCNSKEELEQKEKEYIQSMECVNKVIPTRSYKEYYEANRDKKLEQKKKYHEANKDKILEQMKEWRDANKDTIKEYNKEYYEQNKDKILEQKKENREKTRYTCVCGASSVEKHRRRHEQSKKHTEYINNLKENFDQKNLNEFFEQFKPTLSL